MDAEKSSTSRSLMATLAIAFLTLIVAVLIIVGTFDIYHNYRAQREIVAGRQQLIAEEAANTVAGFIQGKFRLLEAAVKLGNPASLDRDEQKKILAKLMGLQPALRQIVLLDSQEQEVVRISRLSRTASGRFIDRIGSEAFSRVEQGNRYIGTVYVDEVTNEPLVVIANPVAGIFGDFQGTLVAEVNLKFMWDLVDRLKIGEKGLAYVVDRRGNLLAFGDIARVLQGQNLGHLKDVSEFINSLSPVDETRADISSGINGTTIVGTYVPLGIPDWAVVIELPVNEAYREVVRGMAVSGSAILVMAILACLTGVIVARRLAGPLLDLTETATRIAGGEIGLRATIKGPAEVASLARAFNDMTMQLHEMLRKEEERSRKLQQEIFQRRHAEEALKKSEERYRLLVEKMNEGLGVMDRNRVMTYVNDKFCQMIGYLKDEIIGGYPTAFLDEDNQNILREQLERRQRGEAGSYEVTWTGKDGRQVPAIISSTPLYAADGSFDGSLFVITDITERKQAEAALKESEERFREVVENIKEVFWLFDVTEQKVIYVSPAYEKTWGRSTQDLFNRYEDWSDSIHPDDREYAAESFAHITETGGGERREYRIVRPDGKIRWISDTGFTVTGKDGRVQRIAGVADDITERKRAEEELNRSQKLLEDSQRIAHIGSWDMDVKTGELYLTDETFRIFGTQPQSFQSTFDDFISRVHPEDRSMVLTHFSVTQKTKQFKNFEFRAKRPDGSVRWIHDTGEVICDEAGDLVRIIGTVQDVTQRKQMEDALRQNEKRYRSIFETASVALLEEDLSEVQSAIEDLRSRGVADFRRYLEEQPQFILQASRMIKVLDVNKETLKLYGAKDKEELLGSLNKIFVEESLPVFQNLLIAIAEGRTDFQTEGVNQTLQGERRHVLLRTSMPDEKEQFNNLLVSIMDITDRKRAEDELDRYREHLEELVDERTRELEIAQEELLKRERLAVLGQLTATVSHELRNPLGTIRSSNFYLQRKVEKKDEKILKHFSRIDEQVGRCDSIVDDLLEYTRGRHVDAVEAAINPWLDELLDQLLESENIKISRHFPQELPLILYDQEKMRRVMVNLVDNAIQSVKAKTIECKNQGTAYQPEIRVTAGLDDGDFKIEIEDNGIGMDKDTQKRAFEPLFTTRARGTGLGLANVRKIITEHGGTVSIESDSSRGTKVTLTLPRRV